MTWNLKSAAQLQREAYAPFYENLPDSVQTFYEYTEKFFGVGLHLEFLRVTSYYEGGKKNVTYNGAGNGRYEILEDHKLYYKKTETYDYWKKKFGFSVYGLEDTVFSYAIGPLSCGGIARTNYGQFVIERKYHLMRLLRLAKDVERKRNLIPFLQTLEDMQK